MHISHRQFGRARILDVQGPLVGLAAAERLAQTLTPVIRESSSLLVLNLTPVTELDDEVLCVLGAAARDVRQRGGALRVAMSTGVMHGRLSRQIRAFFDCFDSVEDALADLRASMGGPPPRRALLRARAACHRWWRWISQGRTPVPRP